MSMCDNHCTLYPQQVPPQLLRINYRGRLLFMSMVSVWHGIWLLKNSTAQNGIWYIFVRFSANTTVQNGIYGRNGTVFWKLYGFKTVRYMVARDYGIPMVSLTAVKTAVSNRGKFTV